MRTVVASSCMTPLRVVELEVAGNCVLEEAELGMKTRELLS